MRKQKWLFVSGYEHNSWIPKATEFWNSCQGGLNVSLCSLIMAGNNDTWLQYASYPQCCTDLHHVTHWRSLTEWTAFELPTEQAASPGLPDFRCPCSSAVPPPFLTKVPPATVQASFLPAVGSARCSLSPTLALCLPNSAS